MWCKAIITLNAAEIELAREQAAEASYPVAIPEAKTVQGEVGFHLQDINRVFNMGDGTVLINFVDGGSVLIEYDEQTVNKLKELF